MSDGWRLPKPNPAFPDEITALIRFWVAAKGEKLEPCPVCSKRRRGRWTMLCPFQSFTFGQFAVEKAGEHAPLTLVCSEHPINPTPSLMEAIFPGYAAAMEARKAGEAAGGAHEKGRGMEPPPPAD